MSVDPQIRINLVANTATFAALNREMGAMGDKARTAAAHVAGAGRNVDGLRSRTQRAGRAVQQVGKLWDSARKSISRLPDLIGRSSRNTDNLARNARRAKVELRDAAERSRELHNALGVGLGVNLVDRVMQATVSGPRMINQLVDRGLNYNRMMESGATRFEQALGGMEAAWERMHELSDFGATTPFELGGLVEASISLEQLTRGALSTGAGLRLVGDAAAYAGLPIEEMAVHVARLYDGLQTGRPVGISMMRLQELGLITGETRNQIEAMQKAGLKGDQVWAVLAEQLGKYAGQMDKMSATMEGIEANLNDIIDATLGKITEPVFDARKSGLIELVDALEEMDITPLVALGESFANAVGAGLTLTRLLAQNSGAVAMVVRLGGAVIAGGTIVATARATRALAGAYAAWVRANYAQTVYGKQAQVTSAQTTAQTAALNANTIAVNNNALARTRAAAAGAATAAGGTMTAGKRTAWQLQNAGVPRGAPAKGGFRPLAGAGALVGGGALAGAAVATAGLAVGAEWIIAARAASARQQEARDNKSVSAFNKLVKGYGSPTTEEEKEESLSKILDEVARRQALVDKYDAAARKGGGGVNIANRALEERILGNLMDSYARIRDMDAKALAKNAEIKAEIERLTAAEEQQRQQRGWLLDNSADIDKGFEKTRLETLTDAERMGEIRKRLVDGPKGLAKSDAVDVDVAGKTARELTQDVLPALEARLEQLQAGSFDHTKLEVSIKMIREWATELQGLEKELGNLDARAASNKATATDMQFERDILAARLQGNDALVEQLEHSRELAKAEQQVEAIVKAGVLDREKASALLKGMVEDNRKLAQQEKQKAQNEALRDAAGELAVLQLRAAGRDKDADKLERELEVRERIAEIVKATGRDEQWAKQLVLARLAAEDKIKERKEATSKGGKGGRPERNFKIDQSGNWLYRTEDGAWKRREDMSHAERVATGTTSFVRDGAASVGMTPGQWDTAEDRMLGRNKFLPPQYLTVSQLVGGVIGQISPGMVGAGSTVAPASPPAAAPAAASGGSALPAAAATVSTAADTVAGEVSALAATVEAGFERLGAAVTAADQSLGQRIDTVAAQVKANRN